MRIQGSDEWEVKRETGAHCALAPVWRRTGTGRLDEPGPDRF
jgi:hypothetical protein